MVNPQIIDGIRLYRVVDEMNESKRQLESALKGTTSITITGNPPRSIFNPYF